MPAYRVIETVTYTVDAEDADDAAEAWDYADREHDFTDVHMVDRSVDVYSLEDAETGEARTAHYERSV